MAASSVPLNAEPSQPQERAEHDLPPKSYATAATLPHEEQQSDGFLNGQVNGSTQSNGTPTHTNHANGSAHPDAEGKNLDEDRVVFEKYADHNGAVLTSVKPDEGYEEGLKHDHDTAPRDQHPPGKAVKKQDTPTSQLTSGRRAGAGWERSTYARYLRMPPWLTLSIASDGHL